MNSVLKCPISSVDSKVIINLGGDPLKRFVGSILILSFLLPLYVMPIYLWYPFTQKIFGLTKYPERLIFWLIVYAYLIGFLYAILIIYIPRLLMYYATKNRLRYAKIRKLFNSITEAIFAIVPSVLLYFSAINSITIINTKNIYISIFLSSFILIWDFLGPVAITMKITPLIIQAFLNFFGYQIYVFDFQMRTLSIFRRWFDTLFKREAFRVAFEDIVGLGIINLVYKYYKLFGKDKHKSVVDLYLIVRKNNEYKYINIYTMDPDDAYKLIKCFLEVYPLKIFVLDENLMNIRKVDLEEILPINTR